MIRILAATVIAIPLVLGLGFYLTLDHWIYPQGPFDAANLPAAPDYGREADWAALPNRADGADVVPDDGVSADRQAAATVDVFYIHPTSYLVGRDWNADLNNRLANWIVDNGILNQQASVFNGSARVYAPRYRQASQGAQRQDQHPQDKASTLAVAYGDVQQAFDEYLDNFNQGRPFILASHSQGTTHAVPLLRYLVEQRPEHAERMVAAYLIGNTVEEAGLPDGVGVCQSATETHCVVSWNAVAEGGDGSHWRRKGKPVCVNPLTWREDEQAAGLDLNLGSIPLRGPEVSGAPHPNSTGARCEDGILWVTEPQAPGYTSAVREDGSYHAYDYNLFYMNLRANVAQRVRAFEAAQNSP